MSDRTGVPNPSRGGSRVILSGLAMGAVLGAPVAVTAAGAEETSAAAVERVVAPACPAGDSAATTAATIREQFRASFAAGAVTPPAADLTAVICETS